MQSKEEQTIEPRVNESTKNKKLLIIILVSVIIVIVVVAVVLGVVLGTKKDKKDDLIVNSYDNTDELIKKFPIGNPTTVQDGIEAKIQNRLLTGFENWNRGFEAWKAWGNILYTNESIYNVHGARLTLAQYQDSMDVTLKRTNILMGDFHNMLICGEFTAIYYDIVTIYGERRVNGTVMEFVKFKDYGKKLGTRVVEGWGGTNDTSYAGMLNFQGPNEKAYQENQIKEMLEYKIPETEDLKKKYIIKNPSTYLEEHAGQLLDIILKGFEAWNKGLATYNDWLDSYFDGNAIFCGLKKDNRTMNQYKTEMNQLFEKYDIKKIYFDNVLIRDNWVGLHYRFTNTTLATDGKTVGDRMEFLQFEKKSNDWKIIASFIK